MSEDNEWSADGRNILSPDRLEAIRRVLKDTGPIIVEHWFYNGSCSPEHAKAKPGDAFHIWDFAQVCQDNNTLANGKYPDAQSRVPKNGAY